MTATIFTWFKANIQRYHKRGGAAFGRAISFVVSFVLALNKVNIVSVATILVLHVGNFLAIRAPCSFAVRTMRACAQGGSGRVVDLRTASKPPYRLLAQKFAHKLSRKPLKRVGVKIDQERRIRVIRSSTTDLNEESSKFVALLSFIRKPELVNLGGGGTAGNDTKLLAQSNTRSLGSLDHWLDRRIALVMFHGHSTCIIAIVHVR